MSTIRRIEIAPGTFVVDAHGPHPREDMRRVARQLQAKALKKAETMAHDTEARPARMEYDGHDIMEVAALALREGRAGTSENDFLIKLDELIKTMRARNAADAQ